MKQKILYVGAFVSPTALADALYGVRSGHLGREIDTPHVTFRYAPREIPAELFGTPLTVRITGYGCDGENEGVSAEIITDSEELAAMAQEIAVPHITLSVSETGKPVNTRYLHFEPIVPFCIDAVFGGYTSDGTVCTDAAEL